jgi:hypothetical protein
MSYILVLNELTGATVPMPEPQPEAPEPPYLHPSVTVWEWSVEQQRLIGVVKQRGA